MSARSRTGRKNRSSGNGWWSCRPGRILSVLPGRWKIIANVCGNGRPMSQAIRGKNVVVQHAIGIAERLHQKTIPDDGKILSGRFLVSPANQGLVRVERIDDLVDNHLVDYLI